MALRGTLSIYDNRMKYRGWALPYWHLNFLHVVYVYRLLASLEKRRFGWTLACMEPALLLQDVPAGKLLRRLK